MASIARFLTIGLLSIFACTDLSQAQPQCDSYEQLRSYLETAHKLHEIARAMQVFRVPPGAERPPAANLRFYRNDETGLWAVVRIDPPNCAEVIVTGYGWEDVGEARS